MIFCFSRLQGLSQVARGGKKSRILDWLKNYGSYEQGIPAHDTIARVLSCVNPDSLQNCFIQWMKETEVSSERRVLAVDGKTLRSSYQPGDRQSTIHMVSAFATANGVVMGQCKTDQKSNEITAIPELLSLLDLEGSIVTLDAMGCHREIAKVIIKEKGDYLLAVKGNPKTLHDCIRAAFKQKSDEGFCQIGNAHGRKEYREYQVLKASEVPNLPKWPGLLAIGMVTSYRRLKNSNEELHYRYYISSALLSDEEFGSSVRSHWEIENCLHWVLDVAFREDNSRIRKDHSAHNVATMRHVAMNQLRRETSKKASVRRKQRFAAMDVNYLEKVIHA